MTDYQAVTQVQKVLWSLGDFHRVANVTVLGSEQLCESIDLRPGCTLLDVACGSGNTAIAAARRFARVTGVDYVPALLDRARQRAQAELVEAEFVEGDAQALPFGDAGFDVVASSFGVMFAPDQPRAAAELLRVTRPGGTIALMNWTPEGLLGRFFETTTRHAPPPFELEPPMLWGTEARVQELLGDGLADLRAQRRHATWRFPSLDAWLSFFRTWFGPTRLAFERLDGDGQAALEADLRGLVGAANRSGDETVIADLEYLEVIAVRA